MQRTVYSGALSALFIASMATGLPAAAQQGALSGISLQLQDVATGQTVDVAGVSGAGGTFIVFWGNQCVWAQRYEERLADVMQRAERQRVAVLLVNANNAEAFPRESPAESRAVARRMGVPHYLMDPDGRLAAALGAQRIPHLFAFDPGGRLVYQGAIDDSPGDPALVQETYALDVLDALAAGTAPASSETQPFGCRIKP